MWDLQGLRSARRRKDALGSAATRRDAPRQQERVWKSRHHGVPEHRPSDRHLYPSRRVPDKELIVHRSPRLTCGDLGGDYESPFLVGRAGGDAATPATRDKCFSPRASCSNRNFHCLFFPVVFFRDVSWRLAI